MHAPWTDRAGRVSPLRSAVFVALFVPALWLAGRAAMGTLGARPGTEIIHQVGLWTIRWLFLSLAITPFRQIFRWSGLIQVRRMIGVAAFAYAALHLLAYIVDQDFDLAKVASEILLRIYLTIGFAALLGLAALAATSTDGMVRRLGGRNWQRLHRLAYLIAALATIHYFMQSKLEVYEPTVMAGLCVWLFAWRALRAAGRPPVGPGALAGLAIMATLATFIGEALFFNLVHNVAMTRVFDADLSFAHGARPGWVVFAICAAVAIGAGGLNLIAKTSAQRVPSSALRGRSPQRRE